MADVEVHRRPRPRSVPAQAVVGAEEQVAVASVHDPVHDGVRQAVRFREVVERAARPVQSIDPAAVGRDPERAGGVLVDVGDRVVAEAPGDRRVVRIPDEPPRAPIETIEPGAIGRDPEGARAVLQHVRNIVRAERGRVVRVVAVRDPGRGRGVEADEAAHREADPQVSRGVLRDLEHPVRARHLAGARVRRGRDRESREARSRGVEALQHAVGRPDPQPAVAIFGHRPDFVVAEAAGPRGVVAEVVERARVGMEAFEPAAARRDPDAALAVLDHPRHLVVAQRRRIVGMVPIEGDERANRIELVESVFRSDPETSVPVLEHGRHGAVAEAGRVRRIVGVARTGVPLRVAPVQAVIARAHPDVLVGALENGGHLPPQPDASAGRPRRIAGAARGFEPGEAGRRADPHAALLVFVQRQYVVPVRIAAAAQPGVVRESPAADIEAGEAALRADPQPSAEARGDRVHPVGRQAPRVPRVERIRREIARAGVPPGHPAHCRDPEGARGVLDDLIDAIVGQARRHRRVVPVAREPLGTGIEGVQAAVTRADPQGTEPVLVERDDEDVGDRRRVAWHRLVGREPVAVVPIQSFLGPDPHVAGVVLRNRPDDAEREPLFGTEMVEAHLRRPGAEGRGGHEDRCRRQGGGHGSVPRCEAESRRPWCASWIEIVHPFVPVMATVGPQPSPSVPLG